MIIFKSAWMSILIKNLEKNGEGSSSLVSLVSYYEVLLILNIKFNVLLSIICYP